MYLCSTLSAVLKLDVHTKLNFLQLSAMADVLTRSVALLHVDGMMKPLSKPRSIVHVLYHLQLSVGYKQSLFLY